MQGQTAFGAEPPSWFTKCSLLSMRRLDDLAEHPRAGPRRGATGRREQACPVLDAARDTAPRRSVMGCLSSQRLFLHVVARTAQSAVAGCSLLLRWAMALSDAIGATPPDTSTHVAPSTSFYAAPLVPADMHPAGLRLLGVPSRAVTQRRTGASPEPALDQLQSSIPRVQHAF